MALPTDFPDWGSNGNYTTGPDIGTPIVVAPSSGEQAEGFVPDTAAVPQYVNYLFRNARQWFDYLKNLPTRSEFLSSAFVWTNLHKFATRPQLNTPTTRSTRISVMDANECSGTGAKQLDANFRPLYSSAGTMAYALSFRLPVGATLTGVSIKVANGGVGPSVTVELWKSAGSFGTNTMLGTNTASFSGGIASLGVTSPTDFTAENPTDLTTYWIKVASTDPSGISNWDTASVQWTDPGFISTVG